MDINDLEGEYIRYTSNVTRKDVCSSWVGKVRETVGDEVQINGCWHDKKSITVIEKVTIT